MPAKQHGGQALLNLMVDTVLQRADAACVKDGWRRRRRWMQDGEQRMAIEENFLLVILFSYLPVSVSVPVQCALRLMDAAAARVGTSSGHCLAAGSTEATILITYVGTLQISAASQRR